jgi:hypothetical protein
LEVKSGFIGTNTGPIFIEKFVPELELNIEFFRQAESRRRLGLADLDTEGATTNTGSTNNKRKATRDLPAATGTSKRSRLKTSQSAPDDDGIEDDDYSSPEDLTPDYDSDDDDVYRPPRTPSFTNALIRAGSRSTKDSSLDKSRGHHQTDKTSAAAAAPPVVVKKQAGLLLQAAGKGLLNTTPTAALLAAKRGNNDADAAFSELLRPKAPTISFGLYGGHLSIDENSERGIAGLLRASSAGGGGRMGTSGGNAPTVVDEGPFVSLLSKVSSWSTVR